MSRENIDKVINGMTEKINEDYLQNKAQAKKIESWEEIKNLIDQVFKLEKCNIELEAENAALRQQNAELLRSKEQNERRREWCKKRTGLDSFLLADHMDAIDKRNAELVEALERVKRESGTHTIAVGQKTGFALIYDIAKAALANQPQPCGHPRSAIVSDHKGVRYCETCEREARKRWKV
jgi:hypothetical protein